MSTLYVYTNNELTRFVAPRLPAAPAQYEQQFGDQLTNILRLYFNQLDNFNNQLRTTTVSPNADGTNIYFPNGQFASTATQTAAVVNTAYNVTLDTTEAAVDVSLASGYQVVTAKAGRYNFQFSIQVANMANSTEHIEIWFHHNGIDIPRSNSRFGMAARKNSTTPFFTVGTVNLLVDMAAGDNISLQWLTTHVDAKIQAYPANLGPAVPSVILTATFVSKL